MKNKFLSFVALAAAVFATSCTSNELTDQNPNPSEKHTVTLTVSVGDVMSRVGMSKNDSTAKFYWHKGDSIAVVCSEANTDAYVVKFTTDCEDGATTATFTGEVSGTILMGTAYYPYSERINPKRINYFCMPTTYTYNKVESNIFSKTVDGVTSYPLNHAIIPLYCRFFWSDRDNIVFRQVGGLAVIRVDKMPGTEGTLTVAADRQIAGDFTIGQVSKEMMMCTLGSSHTDALRSNQVTFNFSGATKGEPGVFYLPLAKGNYTNLKIELNSGDYSKTVTYDTLTINLKDVKAIPFEAGVTTKITGTVEDGSLSDFDGNWE